ncbi:MAG: hypothetical protein U0289_10015 [Cyclobacteriaceae bacterium]|nr:hypothetical protein [Cyclobacteriaceae bacterium]HQQ82315.1 hypothetical protein [Cyclobacteriaceae bacterium]
MRKVIRTLFWLIFGLYLVIHFFDGIEGEPISSATDNLDELRIDTLSQDTLIFHKRVWNDPSEDAQRQLSYTVSANEMLKSHYYRDTVQVEEDGTEKGFWRNLYYDIYENDKHSLRAFGDSIRELARKDQISDHNLAYTTVSMIQDMPYHYVLSEDSCAVHTDFPCIPSQRYGILSPVEFLYSLSGDCDTRTLTLFTLFKNLGYDPIIINSAQYKHSMLAIDLPSEGDYFVHKGRKFFYWETTATGWMPGMLPPDMNNPDYWTIILDHEFQADPTRSY